MLNNSQEEIFLEITQVKIDRNVKIRYYLIDLELGG